MRSLITAASLLLAACGGQSLTQVETSTESIQAERVYHIEDSTKVYSSSGIGVVCKKGDIVLHGGCELTGVASDAWLTVNVPFYAPDYQGWSCAGWKTAPSTVDDGPETLTAVVACYRVGE